MVHPHTQAQKTRADTHTHTYTLIHTIHTKPWYGDTYSQANWDGVVDWLGYLLDRFYGKTVQRQSSGRAEAGD